MKNNSTYLYQIGRIRISNTLLSHQIRHKLRAKGTEQQIVANSAALLLTNADGVRLALVEMMWK